mgnify:CR=1 FL=1
MLSNDVDEHEKRIDLIAEGLGPMVEIHPPSFDFGNFELGCYNDIDIFIGNVGRAPLEIFDTWIDDTSSAGGEFMEMNGVSPGTVVLPNSWTATSITYHPIDVMADFVQLHVESNDPTIPDATANLTGMGHYEQVILDQYLQEGNNQTDILWVVDNSCSMWEEQDKLATNFDAFIQFFQGVDVDFQLAVVTTDTLDEEFQGRLVGGDDEIILNNALGHELDRVQFDSDWSFTEGASLSLDPAYQSASGNDAPAAWCAGTEPYGD